MANMENKLQNLVDKLEAMTKEEVDIFLESQYQANKENTDAVLNADPKDYELPEGMHIIGSELFD